MNIPKTFTLGSQDYTVQILEKCSTYTNDGMAFLAENRIEVKDNKIKDIKEQTFYHELVHCILNRMGENELCDNEKFVDVFALFLHQFVKTAK